MLRRVLTWIQNAARWPVILGLLSAAGVLTFIMNGTDLPFSTPTIEDHSGGLRILDMRFAYGPEEANNLFDALGTEGRRAYIMLHLVPDMVFPISYALAFAFTSAWFLVRLLPLHHPLQWLSLTPLIAGLADISENLSLVVANSSYPSRIDWLTSVASLLTKIKFGLMPIGVVLLSVMVLLWFIRRRPRSNVPTGGSPASLRPGWFVRRIMNPVVSRLGLATTLAVTGRKSGAERTVPVNVLEHGGKRYLLAPRGETDWVRNIRASGHAELRRRGNSEQIRVSEIATQDRDPLIAAYRAEWDWQVKRYFEQLPDPADHPTFLIDPP